VGRGRDMDRVFSGDTGKGRGLLGAVPESSKGSKWTCYRKKPAWCCSVLSVLSDAMGCEAWSRADEMVGCVAMG
jgi:hypothetical protein